MEFKMTFSMDKKTIECIDRLARALAGIKNISDVPLVAPQEKTEPASQNITVTETPQETEEEAVRTIEEVTAPVEPEPTPQPETTSREYTQAELSKAAAEFARSGGDTREKLQKLIKEKYGVTGLMEIPENRYGEFAADLREMGANI